MKYNPKIHKRKSIRLKGYDYSQKGLYFVTICCQNREHFYGKIEKGEMQLNDAGKMIHKWYQELENKFSDIRCHEMVVMPNHFHCIIENVGVTDRTAVTADGTANGASAVGADLCVCPDINNNEPSRKMDANLGEWTLDERTMDERILGEHTGSPLHRVVQWFKTMSTNEYIRNVKSNDWKRFDRKLWQRNYWEHIIRNEPSYHRISEYIKSNPKNWKNDSLR